MPNGARVERHPRAGVAHEVGDTSSGRSGEAVSLQRGFDGARAENPQFDNSRPVRRREAPTND